MLKRIQLKRQRTLQKLETIPLFGKAPFRLGTSVEQGAAWDTDHREISNGGSYATALSQKFSLGVQGLNRAIGNGLGRNITTPATRACT
jgi:hypothetical protein